MEEPKSHLMTRISDYFRARLWLRDYTINRNRFDGIQTGPLDTGSQAGQEIFYSILNGSITPMDRLTA